MERFHRKFIQIFIEKPLNNTTTDLKDENPRIRRSPMSILPVHVHIHQSMLQETNDSNKENENQLNNVFQELARVIGENIDDIEQAAWNVGDDGAKNSTPSLAYQLITGSDMICFMYSIDRRKPRYRLLSNSHSRTPLGASSASDEELYGEIPVMKFSLRVWLYPASAKSNIAADFAII